MCLPQGCSPSCYLRRRKRGARSDRIRIAIYYIGGLSYSTNVRFYITCRIRAVSARCNHWTIRISAAHRQRTVGIAWCKYVVPGVAAFISCRGNKKHTLLSSHVCGLRSNCSFSIKISPEIKIITWVIKGVVAKRTGQYICSNAVCSLCPA